MADDHSAIDPRGATDQTIYIATENGGIWKTLDGGTTWKPKTDFMPSNSMGAVALDPGNPSVVYAGTGFLIPQGLFKGIGLYKSTDGGDSWTVIGPSFLNGVAIVRNSAPPPRIRCWSRPISGCFFQSMAERISEITHPHSTTAAPSLAV